MSPIHPNYFLLIFQAPAGTKNEQKMMISRFSKNVISEPPRPQIELRIAVSDSSRRRRTVWITFGRFRRNHFSIKNLHFARVTFQFSARGLQARKASADMKAVSARTFQNAPGAKAVLAGVAEKPLKNRLEGLSVPLVAQAAQVASAQPERVRRTLLHTVPRCKVCTIISASAEM